MKMILFLLYYIKLRSKILLGIYKTSNPVSVKWRWKDWDYNYKSRRRHRR